MFIFVLFFALYVDFLLHSFSTHRVARKMNVGVSSGLFRHLG